MEKYIWFRIIAMLLTIVGFLIVVFVWARSGGMRSLPIVFLLGIAAFFAYCAVKPAEQKDDEENREEKNSKEKD